MALAPFPLLTEFGGAVECGIDGDVVAPIEAERSEGVGNKLLKAVSLAGGNHKILGGVVLKNPPHRLDIVWRPTPITLDGEVAEAQLALLSGLDAAGGTDNFARDEALEPKGD